MAEFIRVEEKAINAGDPLIFENKTDCSYDVSAGIVFHKSGIYKVSIDSNKTTIMTVSQKIQDLEQPDVIYRQEALDTIAEMQMPIMRSTFEPDQFIFKGLGMAWNAIDELDPAQPTYTDEEIQKIQDLEQAQLEKSYQLGYAEGKKDAKPKTIKCKDCMHRPIKKDGEIMPPKEDDWKCPCLCEDYYYSWIPRDDFFCANGERTEE